LKALRWPSTYALAAINDTFCDSIEQLWRVIGTARELASADAAEEMRPVYILCRRARGRTTARQVIRRAWCTLETKEQTASRASGTQRLRFGLSEDLKNFVIIRNYAALTAPAGRARNTRYRNREKSMARRPVVLLLFLLFVLTGCGSPMPHITG